MTDQRRFADGDTFQIPPLEYRVVEGRLGPGDLRLDFRWQAERDWHPVALDHVALILDMVADNENITHPPPQAGAGKTYRFLVQVFRDGWRPACHQLHQERARKHKEANR